MPSLSSSGGLSLFLIELGFVLIAVALSLCCGRRKSAMWSKLESLFGKLARRRSLSVILVGLLAAGVRLCFLPRVPVPEPFLTSDFSFLLAADTFSRGRLANPPHPMWVHFESLHIDHLPTYMSMYFPAEGMLLAAGKVIAGHPWWAVWASVALMCAAVCWMLQAWLPPGWALLGGVLTVVRLGLFSYWADSYSGGAIAAIAGALVFGALPRILRHYRARDFLLLALGIGLLLLSRPYEGALICAPACFVLISYLLLKPTSKTGLVTGRLLRNLLGRRFNAPPPVRVLAYRTAPALALMAFSICFLGYYNYRVFGSAFTLPYTVNRATYAIAPHFLFQSPRPKPVYRHAEMRNFYASWELDQYLKSRTPSGFIESLARKPVLAGSFYLGFALALPFFAFHRVIYDKRIRMLLVTAAVFAIGMSLETWLLPHYAAPFTAILYAILLQCMRHLRCWRPSGRMTGVFLVRAIPAICFILVGFRLYAEPLHLDLPRGAFCGRAWFGTAPRGLARAGVLNQLQANPQPQLAIVRYAPQHDPVVEWVYNAADIDASKVIWARDMGPAKNRELLRYYKERQVWLVEPDFNPPRITPYSPTPNRVRDREGADNRFYP